MENMESSQLFCQDACVASYQPRLNITSSFSNINYFYFYCILLSSFTVLSIQHGNKAHHIFIEKTRLTTSVLAPSAHQQTEHSKIYTEAIKKLRNTKQPLHLILQEGSKDEHSRADIASIRGSDKPFFTIKYIKNGKRHVMAILSDDYKICKYNE
jgi:hypothetical protein